MRCCNKYRQCIAMKGERARIGIIVKVFLTSAGMIGRDLETDRKVLYVAGSTNVWQEVQHV